MASISRQIGWGEEEVLGYYISRQLDRLARIRCCTASITTTINPSDGDLLLETGDNILLEGGGNLVLE